MGEVAIEQLEEALDLLSGVDFTDLPDPLLLEWTQRMLHGQRRLDGAISSALRVVDTRDATTVECGLPTRSWLVSEQLLSHADAGSRLKLARSSMARPETTDRLLEGAVTRDQATVIISFLAKLPDAATRDIAEAELLDACRYTDPTTLTRGLRELADRLCLNETAEERAVRIREGRYLHLTDTIDQMVRVDGMLDRVGATLLRKALYPLSQKAGELDERTIPQRAADALVELGTINMRSGELPETAGEPTQATVVTWLHDLREELRAGDICTSTLDGTPITANTARMLACDAGIIPAVMGGASEVLDLGRSTKTWSRAQRRAAKLRASGHCEAPKCRAAINRCDLHHADYWVEHRGPTDLANAIYLCSYHHWLEHHTTWHFTRNKDGTVEVRRT